MLLFYHNVIGNLHTVVKISFRKGTKLHWKNALKLKIFSVHLVVSTQHAYLCIIYNSNHIFIMTNFGERRLPVGLQSFKEIRRNNYAYVDKTDIVWNLVNKGKKFNYLSRPRRFGKSILIDTLQTYFEGRRDLFEGLKIMHLEKEWKAYPVVRFDMSRAGACEKTLRSYLSNNFKDYEDNYGIVAHPNDCLADRFHRILKTAYQKTGLPVAILIDEYDSPLQHSWKTPEHDACTAVYREVFAILKADDEYEKFVFITGITKFTQISLFSVLNNLSNISFDAPFAAICGITTQEITDYFKPEIKAMGEANGWTEEETMERLKANYDGYHFCIDNMVDVYNPFSLVNALEDKKIRNYWATSGATSLLPKFVNDMEINLKDYDNCAILSTIIETSDVTGGGAELFLFQSGYLTIKGYMNGLYLLGFPNHEVRQALYETVLPALAMRNRGDIQSAQAYLYMHMYLGKPDDAKKFLKALIADVPYSNKKLASMDMEERYRLIMSTIFNAIGFRVEVERMLATGRIDMVVTTDNYIYVMELKLHKNGGMAAAEKQIIDNRYTQPFKADKRKTIALAIELDDDGKGLIDWKQVEE